MNWLLDATLEVEPWQVEDYRALTNEQLFDRLKLQDISLDKSSFQSIAEQFDTPEELTLQLLSTRDDDDMTQDQVFLILFELWRRLLPEKTCLSIFCDELDYQIYLYDHGKTENVEALQDAIANLQVILDENRDEGADPVDAFQAISQACANDLETFLYDYIAEQIDLGNQNYASELLDDFSDYVVDPKWFEFLRARLTGSSDPETAYEMTHELMKDAEKAKDLEFNFELISLMIEQGGHDDFLKIVKLTQPLLKCEEDFQDLLSAAADFYHRLDQESIENQIQNILTRRKDKRFDLAVNKNDPDFIEFGKILK
jgi:hypothetical protein